MIPFRLAKFVPLGLLGGIVLWHLLRLNLIGIPALANSVDGRRYVKYTHDGTTTAQELGRVLSDFTLLHTAAASADRIASFGSFNEQRSIFRKELPWRRPFVALPAVISIPTDTGVGRGWATSDHFLDVCSFPMRIRFDASDGVTMDRLVALLKEEPAQCVWITNDLFASSESSLSADAAGWFKTITTLTLSKFRWSRHVYATYAEAVAITDFLISPQHGIEEKFMAVHISKSGFDPACSTLTEAEHAPYGFNGIDSLKAQLPDTETTLSAALPRCQPSLDTLSDRIRNVGWNNSLRRLVILHDLSDDDYRELKDRITGLFDRILSIPSIDVKYPKARPRRAWGLFEGDEASWEAEASLIRAAAGIEAATRASLFIGNAYSATSSLIVGLRLARARDRGEDHADGTVLFW